MSLNRQYQITAYQDCAETNPGDFAPESQCSLGLHLRYQKQLMQKHITYHKEKMK